MEKYNLIANDVRKKILEGVYQPNEQLPFEKDFCRTYKVSKMTVKKALDIPLQKLDLQTSWGRGLLLWILSVSKKMKKMLMDIQMMGTQHFIQTKKITSRVIDFTGCESRCENCRKTEKLRKQASFIKFIVSA